MSERDPFQWRPDGDHPEGADSIAQEVAARIAALPSTPDDAMDWATVAAGLEREAETLGPRPAAAQLLYEVGRIYEEHLGDPRGALGFHRRALSLDPGFLPNLRACRRIAMDHGEDALAADALEAEVAAVADPVARAELLLLRGRLLSGLPGRQAEAREAIARASAAAPGSFGAAEESARSAAASGDREALAEAYARCARAAADRHLSAHYLSAASALLEEGLDQPERAGALALDAFALLPSDPLLRATARRQAERLGRTDALAEILRAEAEASHGTAAAEAWQALAHLEERLGRTENAIAALERGRAAAPAEPLLLAELERLREERGAWADAAEVLEALSRAHLARQSPGHLQEAIAAKIRRAEIEEAQLGRLHLALECCRDVLVLEPGNRAALASFGRLCACLGDWEGLLGAFEAEARAARDERECAQRLFKAAEVLEEKLGRVDDAFARYRQALELDPELVAARAALERLCEAEGRWEDLCALLHEDLRDLHSPAEQGAHLFRIARIREERLGDLPAAAEIYRRMLELDPESRVAFSALAAALGKLGQVEELAGLLAREAAATRDVRRRVAILQRRAELIDEHLDDPDLARAAWEEIRAASPSHLPALRALGRLHARAHRWEDLAAMYRAEGEVAADPATAADLYHRTGEVLERRLGRSDEAVAAYREALTLAPAHAPALQALARLTRARGDHGSLVEILHAQAAIGGTPSERAGTLAEAARIVEDRLSDPDRAIEAYEEALAVLPGFPPAVRALDRLYAKTGLTARLAALRRAAGSEPGASDRAERLLRLARLEADRVGDADAALRATEALLDAAPSHPAALLLELRLAGDPERRARARAALAEHAAEPDARAALLAAAAMELRSAPARREALARAAQLAPATPALAPEEERRLREAGDFPGLARFCEARRDESPDAPSRACWSVHAGEAWARADDAERALAAFQAALKVAPASLPALRGARAIFARRSDWAAVRGTLQAEGAALRDPHGAAAAWLAAGEIAERCFADPDAAAGDYRMAAERDPQDPEPLRRLEGLLGARGASEVAALHEARARAERDARRAAESWLASARAALEGDGGREAALVALDRGLLSYPEHAAALELRARLRAEAGRHRDALADLEALIALGGDAAARLMLHLSAAAICEEGLRDPPRTLAHLLAALALAPENPEALARLARVHSAAGRPAEAAAALRRLVEVPDLPREALLEHLLALGEADERLGSVEAALTTARRALDLDPGHEGAHRARTRLELPGDPEARLAGLEAAATQARDPALRADAHVEAARLLAGPLGRPEDAVVHLRAALDLDPSRDGARATLADLLDDVAPAASLSEHRRILGRDPLRVASWSALFRYFQRTRAHDRAFVVAAVLRWLGADPPGPDAEQLLREGARFALPPPPQISAEDLDLLRAPGDGGPLATAIEVAGDAIAAAIGEPQERHGDPLRDHPLRRVLAETARALAAPEWEIYAGTVGRVDVEPAVPYAVHVGPDVARRTTAREQRFLVGRAAARLRTRSCLAELLPPAALAGWVAAALRCALPEAGPPADEELVRRVGRTLSRRARRALEGPARALEAGVEATAIAAWRTAATATADRLGLVLAGDVPAAIGLLLREGGVRPVDGSVLASAAARPEVLALLSFAASEEHFVLRQRLRVAIA